MDSSAPPTPTEEWDKTTDSIHSDSSDELYNSRPNRWRGSKASWRSRNEGDRAVYTALEALRHSDLSVHLYNAFALKKGPRMTISQTGELLGYESVVGKWAPPRAWTAWPMGVEYVPSDDLMPMQPLDEDSGLTFRKMERTFPRTALAEEVAALILRAAKEKFLRREEEQEMRGDAQNNDQEDVLTGGEEDNSEAEQDSDLEMKDARGHSAEDRSISRDREMSPEMIGVPSADDEASNALLQPVVGDIISKLEKTLLSLHNMMVATIQSVDDRDDDDSEDGGVGGSANRPRQGPTPKKARRSISRSPKKRRRAPSEAAPPRGRRLAVAVPEPLPVKRDAQQSLRVPGPAAGRPRDSVRKREDRLLSLVPRDWRTVLGAASMSGFSPPTTPRPTTPDPPSTLVHTPLPSTTNADENDVDDDDDDDDAELAEIIRLRLRGRELLRSQDHTRPLRPPPAHGSPLEVKARVLPKTF
ncbi:unnamed protein product [Parascedosporium putredinis]|uniref:Rrn9 domain-containing protein n=1 Tax=Parascedosporium putredinis TaxID=1442378 RepID=A0A9P1H864_9PEZI|nr:unnamed protein product [Parascedosporium putredinis]CAI8001909.1 unnamed protein product [Parascedosporium putredinis]